MYYLIECVLRLLLLHHQLASGWREYGGKSSAKSYHFTTTFVELFDRLVELLHRERHSDAAAQGEPLSLELLQPTGSSRCCCFLKASMIPICNKTGVCAVG